MTPQELTKGKTYIHNNQEIIYDHNTINYRIFYKGGERIELSENMIKELTKK